MRLFWLLALAALISTAHAEIRVKIGSTFDLTEQASGVSREMLVGLKAAFDQAPTQGIQIEHIVHDDKYDPVLTASFVHQLIEIERVVALVGSTGTPNAVASLPLITQANIPAIGFYTGADILRTGTDLVVNFRPSYADEVVNLFERFLRDGILPQQVCLYLQNDSFGLSGITGLRRALSSYNTTEVPAIDHILQSLNAIEQIPADQSHLRNGMGPVGFYDRTITRAREGFESLRDWERVSGQLCRAIIIVATQDPALDFMFYSRRNRRAWAAGLVSVMNRDYLERQMRNFADLGTVYFSQVVPPVDADLPIVQGALTTIGLPPRLNTTSLEGYIVGRLVIHGIKQAAQQGQVTGEALVRALLGNRIELDGLTLDFTRSNQGSQRTWLWQFDATIGQFALSE